MTKTGTLVLIIILAIAAIIGFSVYKGNQAPKAETIPAETMRDGMDDMVTPEETASSTPTPDVSVSVGVDAGTVKSFIINGSNFSFSPSTMTVNKGDTVKITFKNTGGFHDLKIDEFNVATAKIQGGAEETVTFVADKTGSFEYYCSIGTHRQMGMKGTLTVK